MISKEQKELSEQENQEEFGKPEKSNKLLSSLMKDILTFIICAVAVILLTRFVIINARIPSASMETTIMTGDRMIGNRLAYKFNDPERYDIVIFKDPEDSSKILIKRVIGLSGDTLYFDGKDVYLVDENSELTKLDDSFVQGITQLSPYWKPDEVGGYTIKVPKGCYLVLGDNRENSEDSRYWVVNDVQSPFIEKEDIIAKAGFRYYPFNKIGFVK